MDIRKRCIIFAVVKDKEEQEMELKIMTREEAAKTLPVSMLETISDATDKILIFPTEEMRDAFYKNFQSEIKRCKELSVWDVIKLEFVKIIRRIKL